MIVCQRPLDVRRLDNPWVDSFAVTEDGVVVDVSGYSARMQFRLYPGAPDPALLDVSSLAPTVNGSIIDMGGGFEGVITIRLAKADMVNLPLASVTGQPFGEAGTPAVLAYDLLLTDAAGNESTWFDGPVNVYAGVTRHG